MSGVEILGLAASVIQIAELGGKLSVRIFTFTRKVKNANKTIDALSQEIAVTGAVLQQLGEILSQDESVKVCSQEAIDTAKKLVSDTEKVFHGLENLLDVENKPNSRIRKAVSFKGLKFPFLESEIEQVQANLERLKSSLLVILSVLGFAEQLRNRETLPILQDQRELIRTLIAEKNENELRYERILKAIANRPTPQGSDQTHDGPTFGGSSDASSFHSSTLTLVNPANDAPRPSAHSNLQDVDWVVGPSLIESLPAGLKHRYDTIHDHAFLVQNLLSEIDSLHYRLDHGIRGRMHAGVLDTHWSEWSKQRKLFGNDPFEKIFANSTEVAKYWADRAIEEQLAKQGKLGVEDFACSLPDPFDHETYLESRPTQENQSPPPHTELSRIEQLNTEIDDVVGILRDNMNIISQRGDRLDGLAHRTDDLTASAQFFRFGTGRVNQRSWSNIISAPIEWVGSVASTVSSLPTRLWNGLQNIPSQAEPVHFRHEVTEPLNAGEYLEALKDSPRIGLLSVNEAAAYANLRGQMAHPERTLDRCTRSQLNMIRGVFNTFADPPSRTAPLECLGDMIRSLGHDPSDQTLHDRVADAGIGNGGSIGLEDYIEIVLGMISEPEALQCNDPDSSRYPSGDDTFSGGIDENKATRPVQDVERPGVSLTAEEKEELREVFELFDPSGTGKIETTEIRNIMKSLGQNLADEELQGLIDEIDTDGTGQLDLQDFIGLMTTLQVTSKDTDSSVREAFKVFDKNGDNLISTAEVKALLEADFHLPNEEIDAMMKDIDEKGTNARIDYDTLVSLLSGEEVKEIPEPRVKPSEKDKKKSKGQGFSYFIEPAISINQPPRSGPIRKGVEPINFVTPQMPETANANPRPASEEAPTERPEEPLDAEAEAEAIDALIMKFTTLTGEELQGWRGEGNTTTGPPGPT